MLKCSHPDNDSIEESIRLAEENVEQLRRQRADMAASPALAPPAIAIAPAPQLAQPLPAQPSIATLAASSTLARRQLPPIRQAGQNQHHQPPQQFRRTRDQRGRIFFVYVCNEHADIYCHLCGQYISSGEFYDRYPNAI